MKYLFILILILSSCSTPKKVVKRKDIKVNTHITFNKKSIKIRVKSKNLTIKF